jgi:hypothetical protein
MSSVSGTSNLHVPVETVKAHLRHIFAKRAPRTCAGQASKKFTAGLANSDQTSHKPLIGQQVNRLVQFLHALNLDPCDLALPQ